MKLVSKLIGLLLVCCTVTLAAEWRDNLVPISAALQRALAVECYWNANLNMQRCSDDPLYARFSEIVHGWQGKEVAFVIWQKSVDKRGTVYLEARPRDGADSELISYLTFRLTYKSGAITAVERASGARSIGELKGLEIEVTLPENYREFVRKHDPMFERCAKLVEARLAVVGVREAFLAPFHPQDSMPCVYLPADKAFIVLPELFWESAEGSDVLKSAFKQAKRIPLVEEGESSNEWKQRLLFNCVADGLQLRGLDQ